MYPRQLRMLFLFMAMWLVVPTGQAMGQIIGAQAAGSITLPVAGTVMDVSTSQTIGQFNGSFTINSFARTQIGQIVAVGMVRGVITNPASQVLQSGLQSITLPVSLASLTATNLKTLFLEGTRPSLIPASFTTAGGGAARLQDYWRCHGRSAGRYPLAQGIATKRHKIHKMLL
jgi:hypothetical protein